MSSRRRYLKSRRLLLARGEWRGLISSVGTQRRLRALAATGWSWESLAVEACMEKRFLQRLAAAERHTVHPATHDRIAALYERLSMTVGPSSRTRCYAERSGWHPPLAWDDIDDPDEQPGQLEPVDVLDEIAVERYMNGTLQHPRNQNHTPELVEAVRRMAPTVSDRQIGLRVGLTLYAIAQLRRRHGITQHKQAA